MTSPTSAPDRPAGRSLPERIRRRAARWGACACGGAIAIALLPGTRAWFDTLFAIGLFGLVVAWVAATAGRFDSPSSGTDSSSSDSWFDSWLDGSSDSSDGGDSGGGDGGGD